MRRRRYAELPPPCGVSIPNLPFERPRMRYLFLWLIGIPIPVLILIWLFFR